MHRGTYATVAYNGDKMVNPPDEGTPAPQTPDLAKMYEEQKAVLAAMSEKIQALEAKNAQYDAKITALTAAPAANKPTPDKAAAAKSELDKAYEKVLADLGIKKEA